MQPRLQPGDVLLTLPWLNVRVGDIVLARVDGYRLVKAVARLEVARVDLKGWGSVWRSELIGRVVCSWPRRRPGAAAWPQAAEPPPETGY
jgi:hypothetical protein